MKGQANHVTERIEGKEQKQLEGANTFKCITLSSPTAAAKLPPSLIPDSPMNKKLPIPEGILLVTGVSGYALVNRLNVKYSQFELP